MLRRTVQVMALATLVRTLTTPLLPDDYLAYVNPLWSTREPRGVVAAVLPETGDAATLWISVPSAWPAHAAGQYVRVGVDIDGVRHWRTYSLTGGRRGRIAITVKAMPDGFVSRKLVFGAPPGTVVRLAPPTGEFVLPDPLPQRLLFVTAGSGITPVMAMLRHLAARFAGMPDVLHVHLAPSQADVIFGDELRRLARRHERYVLREHHDDVDGLFDVTALPADRAALACGPAGLLDALDAHLPDLTVERFRPVVAAVAGEGGTATFTASRKTVRADGATPLLVAGEQAGALLPSGCRMGICHSCVGRLTAGAVRDLRTGDVIPAEDQMVRACVTAAAGPCEIDL
jgi:stearoyl-CoA 9-desaturase NADPH oxidoreductase